MIIAAVAIGAGPTVTTILFFLLYRREREARLRCEARARSREATFAQALGAAHRQSRRMAQIERELVEIRTTITAVSITVVDGSRR